MDIWMQTSYSLTELSRTRLGKERKELVPSEIPNVYQSSSTLLELVCLSALSPHSVLVVTLTAVASSSLQLSHMLQQ
jgi:hypothetical protein